MGGIRLTFHDIGAVDVQIFRSARARRVSIRIDSVRGAVLVLPPHVTEQAGAAFVRDHAEWIRQRLPQSLPPSSASGVLQPGQTIPYRGVAHVIRHFPSGGRDGGVGQRGVWVENQDICVRCQIEHLPRRVVDFLTQQAAQVCRQTVPDYAERLGVSIGRVTVRDTRSRWGSCSATGNLSFCWRLILAPDWVFAYVIAHEVAHRLEMNHSPQFWAVVGRLTQQAPEARAWLKQNGHTLHQLRLIA